MNKLLTNTTGLILAGLLFIAAIVLVNSTVTGLRLDLTEEKLFTLSEGTVNIVRNLEEPVQLRFYFSQKELTGFPNMLNYGIRVRDLLEEYASKSNGNLELLIINPEPFSEEEDEAVAYGLQSIPVNAAGDRAYVGLVGVNSTDDEEIIPIFQAEKEASLEYDISKLIFGLANPKKPVIGIMSTLPMASTDPQQPNWVIVERLQEFFELEEVGIKTEDISKDIDVLMIVHPKSLSDKTLYAIDQYLLHGGKAMVFVDPLSEGDPAQSAGEQMVMPDIDSDLIPLFDTWGIEVLQEKIIGDSNAAMRVQARGAKGIEEVAYLPWLALGAENLNDNDFTTADLNVINVGTASVIQAKESSSVTISPLIQTTLQSMILERDLILFQRDPKVMMDNFVSSEKKHTIAARISGSVATSFPDGKPDEKSTDDNFKAEGEINLILVADSDLLRDMFWVRTQNFFGMDIPQAIADNANFVINSLDNLSGNTDLISLRSRGVSTRPFDKVESIRREAEAKFRQREQELMAELKATEEKIQALQNQQGADGSAMILTDEQKAEIENFRQTRLKVRKELRSVQLKLKRNIERLGNQLKFINIGLIPLIIIILTLSMGLAKSNRRVKSS